MTGDTREAFEEIALDRGLPVTRNGNDAVFAEYRDQYRDDRTQAAWSVFKVGPWQSQQAQGDPVAWRVTNTETGDQFVMGLKDPERYKRNYPEMSLEPCFLAPPAPAAVPEADRETIALAAGYLGDWLDANECECEMGHICGRPNVERTRQRLLDMLCGEAGNQ